MLQQNKATKSPIKNNHLTTKSNCQQNDHRTDTLNDILYLLPNKLNYKFRVHSLDYYLVTLRLFKCNLFKISICIRDMLSTEVYFELNNSTQKVISKNH